MKQIDEAVKFAKAELAEICGSWIAPFWDELDWGRIQDLQLRDVLDARKHEAAIAERAQCIGCPKFVKHVRYLTSGYRSKSLTRRSLQCAMTNGSSKKTSSN